MEKINRKQILLTLALLCLASCGCSQQSWLAKYFVFKAENAYTKAHEMRSKKGVEEKRVKLYRRACDSFLKAYNHDPSAFTLYRIEIAAESCQRVGNAEATEEFRDFEAKYASEHPTEVEYGDAVPMMDLE